MGTLGFELTTSTVVMQMCIPVIHLVRKQAPVDVAEHAEKKADIPQRLHPTGSPRNSTEAFSMIIEGDAQHLEGSTTPGPPPLGIRLMSVTSRAAIRSVRRQDLKTLALQGVRVFDGAPSSPIRRLRWACR